MSKYQENKINVIYVSNDKNNLHQNKEKQSSLYIKSLIQKLLQNSLEYPLSKLEISNSQQIKDLSLLSKNFESFNQQISSFRQNFNEQELKKEILDKIDKTYKSKTKKNSISKDHIKKTIANTNTANTKISKYKKIFNKCVTSRGPLVNHNSQLTERKLKKNDNEKKLEISNININMNKTQIIFNSRNSIKQTTKFSQKQNNTKSNSLTKNNCVITDYNSNGHPNQSILLNKKNEKKQLNNSAVLPALIDNKKNTTTKLNKTLTNDDNNNHNNNNKTEKKNHRTKIKKNLLKPNNNKNKQNKFIDTYNINNTNNNTDNNNNFANKSCEPSIKNSIIKKNDTINEEKDKMENVENIVKLVDDVNQNISEILTKGGNSHRKSVHQHPPAYPDLNSVISNLNNKILKGIKKTFQNSSNENNDLNNYVSSKKNKVGFNISSSKKVNETPFKNELNAKNKKLDMHKFNSSKVINEITKTNFSTNNEEIKKKINFTKIKNITMIFENWDFKLLNSILKYLTMKESLFLLSANKNLLKERNIYLNLLKNDIIKIANLNNNETIEDKINLYQVLYTTDELNGNPKNFKISADTLEYLEKLKADNNIPNFCNNFISFYRILLILLNENTIYNTLNNKEFLAKCLGYFYNDDIGSFLIEKSNIFDFAPKNIYLIKKVINENKIKSFNIDCEQNSFNECVKYLVKDALEYCGIIDDKNIEPNIMINGILFNKMQIEKIEQIIKNNS